MLRTMMTVFFAAAVMAAPASASAEETILVDKAGIGECQAAPAASLPTALNGGGIPRCEEIVIPASMTPEQVCAAYGGTLKGEICSKEQN